MSEDSSTPSPGTFLVYELEKRGWSQRELSEIIDRPFQMINEIVKGKRSITAETAVALGAAFGDGPEVWLQREAAYQVANSEIDTGNVERRARLYDLAPVKEMERRGWIKHTNDTTGLEEELKRFFGVETLDGEPPWIGAVTRKSDADEPLTPSQRAWCFRVRQVAAALPVPSFDTAKLGDCKKKLRLLAAYPQEGHKVAGLLAQFGIRFVVVEPLAGAKVDGVAMWIDKDSPAIGMSVRYDRVDSFWFTLCHELSHVEHHDDSPLDADLGDHMDGVTIVRKEMERRANDEAADILIPREELRSFILRVGPLYSKAKIIKFAHRMKMHPGIVVGQLQRRHEIGYHANREMLSKIRDFVVSAAITDGWGHTIDQRSFE